ncbi:putative short-chain dehydrogenase [Nemania abortiva]|nr:putative short-chain dehydrogenase [Nemania abortiva]
MNRSLYRSFTTQVLPLPYPSQTFAGKTVLITGANTGIGLEAARHFVHLNAAKVVLGCRDLEKGEKAKRDIEATNHVDPKSDPARVEVWQVDLASFASVQAFCERAASSLDRLDVFIANAATLGMSFATAEGHERITTVNLLSTWLMALLLLPVLRRTKERYYGKDGDGPANNGSNVPHLVVVGSNAHFYTVFDGCDAPSVFEHLRSGSDMFHRYANTKLLSLLVAREVAAQMLDGRRRGRADEVVLNIVEPGSCRTELLREKVSWPWAYRAFVTVGFGIVGRTPEMGARTYVSAAASGWESHGVYLEDCKPSTPHQFVTSEQGARLQKKVYRELLDILEGISPGISGNI